MKQKMAFEPKPEKRETTRKVDVEGLKDKEWGVQSRFLEQIKKDGVEACFRGKITKEAFSGKAGTLLCMDEREAMRKVRAFYMPGLGIADFLNLSRPERLKKVAEIVVGSGLGINKFEFHKSPHVCGAAEKACRYDNSGKKITNEFIDKYAEDWAVDLSKEVKEQGGGEIKVDSTPADEMIGQEDFHGTGIAYIIGHEKVFNPGFSKDLPPGFGIHRGMIKKVKGEEAAKKSSCNAFLTACRIALGGHGFGKKKFNAETPFVGVIVAENKTQLDDLRKEYEDALKNDSELKEDFEAGKIMVDGLVVEV